jgi:hypothetical protein
MPWLEQIPEPKVAASGDSQPSQKPADGQIQHFPGLDQPVQSQQNLNQPTATADQSEQAKINKTIKKADLNQDQTITELKNFSPLSLEDQAKLARGLLGVIIKANSSC